MSDYKQVTDEQVTYAYSILESFGEAFDKVAASKNTTEKLELMRKLNQEYVESIPSLCEAFMILSSPEHRQVIHKFFFRHAGVYESWRRKTK